MPYVLVGIHNPWSGITLLSNRDFTEEEASEFGVFGKIHDSSAVPFGERVGVILVHGRAGNESVMWVFSKAIEMHDPIVIAPRATKQDEIGGYSWWDIGQEVSFEEVCRASEHISTIARAMPEKYGVDPKKIIIIGFSQGGAVSISSALLEPDLFLGVGMLASFVPRVMMRLDSPDEGIPKNVFISHGTKDEVVTIERALLGYEFLKERGVSVHFSEDDVGHKISSSSLRQFKEWISKLCDNG